MSENALARAVSLLMRQSTDYDSSKKVEANAQCYRDLSTELAPLQKNWASARQVYRQAVSVGAPVPSEFAELKRELQELLMGDFDSFEGAYLSTAGVQTVRQIAQPLERRLDQMKQQLQKSINDRKQKVLDQLDDMTARARIRRECGLTTNEPGIEALRAEVNKLFSMLPTLKTETIPARWQQILRTLDDLGRQHTLHGISGLSQETVAFLQRLMSDDRNRPTLADMTTQIFTELQRFPALLTRVSLVRKGEAR